MVIFVLKENDRFWHCLEDEETLQKWLRDGSISEGDIIVYPHRVFKAISVVTLEEIKDGKEKEDS